MKIAQQIFRQGLTGICLIAAGCAPQVRLTTQEPLKVDIAMKVEVYQKEGAPTSTQRKLNENEIEALRRRDVRSGEIWAMKNDGVAVEGAQGYLESHPKSGWDAAYIQKLVDDENKDRKALYEAEAADTARPVTEIETEAGKRFRQQTYSHGPAK